MLSWEAIIEALLENDFLQNAGEDGPASAHLVSRTLLALTCSLTLHKSFYGLTSADAENADPVPDPEHVVLSVSHPTRSLSTEFSRRQ